MEDLNKGEIYLITNKINGKKYVGQAMKYVSSNNVKWGTIGRWNSHVREAISCSKDHCLLLNQAIRKYGKESFSVSKICDCLLNEMDYLEKKYMIEYDTLVPSGYNLKQGGSNGKASQESIDRMKNSREGLKHTEVAKTNIAKGQIGNRRTTKERKYPEDSVLPKYIVAYRKDNEIYSYGVCKFPIGINSKQYISKTFSVKNGIEDALYQATMFLNSLKEKYKDIDKEIKINKEESDKNTSKTSIEQKWSSKLPLNIYPILSENKITGFYTEGIKGHDGTLIPRKDFTKNTNKYNLSQAIKYIQQIQNINENTLDIDDWSNIQTIAKSNKSDIDTQYLPKYINTYKYKGIIVGYIVNGIPFTDSNGKTQKYSKVFSKQKYTPKENYNLAINHLEEMLLKLTIIKN
jgi:hypothetical protein